MLNEHPRVTTNEIDRMLKLIAKRKQAPGPDGIPAMIIKRIIDIIPVRVAKTLDLCFSIEDVSQITRKKLN